MIPSKLSKLFNKTFIDQYVKIKTNTSYADEEGKTVVVYLAGYLLDVDSFFLYIGTVTGEVKQCLPWGEMMGMEVYENDEDIPSEVAN